MKLQHALTGGLIGIFLLLCAITLNQSLELNRISAEFNALTLKEQHQNLLLRIELEHANSKIEGLNNKVVVLEDSYPGTDKRHKARVNKAIEIINASLPNVSPFPGCPKTPTPGEIWLIANTVIDSSNEFAVPASLILAVIRQESAYCNHAVSSAGARGYMQLMPETAAEVAGDVLAKNKRMLSTWRGKDNIQLGTAYLAKMLLEFEGDTDLAIQAYNAGPIHIKRVRAGEMKLYRETEQYLIHVNEFKKDFERLGL